MTSTVQKWQISHIHWIIVVEVLHIQMHNSLYHSGIYIVLIFHENSKHTLILLQHWMAYLVHFNGTPNGAN